MDSFHPGGHYPLLDEPLYHSGFLDSAPSNLDQQMSPRSNRNAVAQQSGDLSGNVAHKSSTGETSLDSIEKLLQQVAHSLLELLDRQKRTQEENRRTQEETKRTLDRLLDSFRTFMTAKRPAQRAARSHIPQYNEPAISETSQSSLARVEGMMKEIMRSMQPPQQTEPQYPLW